MSCFLFDKIIFGPVNSRRLGRSLGINLMPHNKKICTFDCIYCECGWTKPGHYALENPYNPLDVKAALEETLQRITNEQSGLDNITFGGNGEPTLHPDFERIVNDALELRNKYFPTVKLSVLSNATTLYNPSIVRALKKTDNPILKLDAGSEEMLKLINRPMTSLSLPQIAKNIKSANLSHCIIQTLFVKGTVDGQVVDNTTPEELKLWLGYLADIKPRSVMLYGIARETPAHNLIKVDKKELDSIALQVRALGIEVETY